jgi:predicted nuclease with TOPRIM domain
MNGKCTIPQLRAIIDDLQKANQSLGNEKFDLEEELVEVRKKSSEFENEAHRLDRENKNLLTALFNVCDHLGCRNE